VNPLSLLYGSVSAVRNLIYDTGWFTARLQGPVVSVGNISVGGTGKTPFIIYLGEQLKQRGIKLDVLSRGYGRLSQGVRVVDAAGSPKQYGDEPLLIARRLGVPIIVGESRYHAGLVAEQRFGPRLHLLDDGFQHRQLHRDLDIVLLGENDLKERLLPAGRLRESVAALGRANILIVDGGEAQLRNPAGSVHTMRRTMALEPRPAGDQIAFCGIARPHGFFAGLRAAGAKVVAERAFRDHHKYSEADIRELQKIRESSGAAGFVTTEKDQINLGNFASELSPMSVVKLDVSVDRPEELVTRVVQSIAGRQRQAAKS
jgi:tetraacyldisaccharide 4'-kinase